MTSEQAFDGLVQDFRRIFPSICSIANTNASKEIEFATARFPLLVLDLSLNLSKPDDSITAFAYVRFLIESKSVAIHQFSYDTELKAKSADSLMEKWREFIVDSNTQFVNALKATADRSRTSTHDLLNP
ncbi:MAG: hypothetical protein EPN41_09875 [Candidimonas sp.]|nr:MAG: hypothetical protein EPN41_09875 [Candidimonas sp.]